MAIPRIVIVGGGAGGLELAVMLGEKLAKKNLAAVLLVNDTLTHIWKPLLHEVAAGTLDSHEDELNYISLAHTHHFYFELGSLTSIDRQAKNIEISAQVFGSKDVTQQKRVNYDFLVLALGSITHDFNTPGAKEYCFFLDSRSQAESLHQQMLSYFMTQDPLQVKPLDVVIVGGGATGVELAAELSYAAKQLQYYGFTKQKQANINLTIIEAGKRLLAALPEALSNKTRAELENKGIRILLNERVKAVTAEAVHTKSEQVIPATFKIWTAGVKCADFLKNISGLETNHLNQILVKETLQTTVDDNIFALGDCAACPQPGSDRPVPPRAQAAHQEAILLADSLPHLLRGGKPLRFRYRDYGSLITLSNYTTVGQLMTQRGLRLGLEGRIARWIYNMLYKRHQAVLLGWWQTILLSIARWLTRPAKPRLKLH